MAYVSLQWMNQAGSEEPDVFGLCNVERRDSWHAMNDAQRQQWRKCVCVRGSCTGRITSHQTGMNA